MPAVPPFRVEPLGAEHDRTGFDCGNETLDRYFRDRIGQDSRRRLATPFVLLETGTTIIAGFYTLSAEGVALASLPPAIVKKLPRYPMIPATLLSRLAIHRRYQERGAGKALMVDALLRACRAADMVASFAVVVDPIDEGARVFYLKFGFRAFDDNPRRLFLPMQDIAALRS